MSVRTQWVGDEATFRFAELILRTIHSRLSGCYHMTSGP